MKSDVETLNPTRVKLTVEVPYEELKPSLDAAYVTIASQVTIPGFRKGKVPPRIIDQRVGRGPVIEEAVNEALPKLYVQAVQEADVRPLGQPSVEVTAIPDAKDGGDLKFVVEVDVRPTIELPDLSNVTVEVDAVEVDDAAVEEKVENLRERFGTLTPVERAAADQDFVTIDISATIENEPIDAVSGISYQVGAGNMLPGMDEQLVGMSAGESKTYTTKLAGGDRAEEDAEVELTLQAVKERQLPDVDDEFAQLASEFDTIDELREDLRKQAGAETAYQQGLQARDKLLEQLLEQVEIPVPEQLILDEVNNHLSGEGREADDVHRAEVDEEARKAFKAQMLLDVIAETEDVQVGQQELIEYLITQAQQYRMQPDDFIKALDENNQVPSMVQEVARRKALGNVLSRATVKDTAGNVIDLEALFPTAEDDTLGDLLAEDGEPVAEASTAGDPTAIPVFDSPVKG